MTLDSSRLPTPIASFGLHPSRIQDSTFDLGGNRCARRAIAAPSPPASSRLPTPNPSFGLHPSRIQDSTFDLSGNRCARSAIAFKLYTFLGNDCLYERSVPTLSWRAHSLSRCARPLSVGARTISVGEHSVDPLSVGAPSVCPLSVGPLSVVARASSHLVRVLYARPVGTQ